MFDNNNFFSGGIDINQGNPSFSQYFDSSNNIYQKGQFVRPECPTEIKTKENINDLNPDSIVRFYHTPKVGGTAIFNLTSKWKNFHRAHRKKNHVPIKFYPPQNGEYALTIIRHPYERFVSAFYHLVDACDEDFYYRYAKVSDCETLQRKNIHFGIFRNDPNEFLIAYESKSHPYHNEARVIFNTFSIFKPQFYWLSDLLGKKIHDKVKIVLHQEQLQEEFEQVAEKLGHQYLEWPDHRSSNRRITKEVKALNDYSKSILQKIYAEDFQHFCFIP